MRFSMFYRVLVRASLVLKPGISRVSCCLVAILLLVGSQASSTTAATLPAGFTEAAITGITSATAMTFAPDGRLFVCQQGGQLRVIKNGALLATPFVTISVNSSGERGLLGVAFDSNFASNSFVYVYYTTSAAPIHNRVSRFVANGDVAVPGSETVILDLNNLSGATNHNGGAIHFGPDRKLYIAAGENANPANSQTVGNLLGKILRINSDGTIPSDNPTSFPGIAGSPTGVNRAIWTVGLRNPFTFGFQPGTGRIFINDVGQVTWEEINDGIAGSNYGWNTCEGACAPPNANFRDPLFQYGHGGGTTTGCAIVGAAFYNPSVLQFPSDYTGKYFFADLCSGWIRRFDPATSMATGFATGVPTPVDLQVADDGSLYYLTQSSGVFHVQYSPAVANSFRLSASSYSVNESGLSVAITVMRDGSNSSPATVDFATFNGTASDRTDYTTATGTVSFAAGETSNTFTILITDDVYVESNETLNIALKNPTGGPVLGANNTATLTINDNDAAGPSIPQKRFGAALTGTQETPPNGSAGSGQGYVLLNSNDTSGLVGMQFANLGSAETDAHIHTGALGVAGGITFPLPTTNPVIDFSISSTAQQVTDLKAGQQYINVHSTNFPGGEIRGQLLWNPTLEDAFFVRQHYLDFLNREPEAGGLAFWLGELQCPNGDLMNAQCYHDRTVGVSNAFYFSGEFQLTASFVFLAYRAAYGNTQPFPNPDPLNVAEANKLPDYNVFMADRPRVLGGANLEQQQLAFSSLFVTRPEFTSRYGAGLNTAVLFVDAVLANIQASDGVTFSAADRTELINHYNNASGGNAGRAMVMWHLSNDYWNTCAGTPPCVPVGFGTAVDNRAFIDANYNRQFALILYFGYLRRNPEIGGFLFWQDKINQAPVRNVPKQNSLVCSFLTSGEYQARFGPFVTFNNSNLFPRTNAECPP
jgi:glucose/arabinose dehydrogenase